MRAAVLTSIGDAKLDVRDDVSVVGPGPGQVRWQLPGVRVAGIQGARFCASD